MIRFLLLLTFSMGFQQLILAQEGVPQPLTWYYGYWETKHNGPAGQQIFIEPGKDKDILQAHFHGPAGTNKTVIGQSDAYAQFLDDDQVEAYEIMGRFKANDQETMIKFFLRPDESGNLKALMYIARGELAREMEMTYHRIDPPKERIVSTYTPEKSVGNLGVIEKSIRPEIKANLKAKPVKGKIYGAAQGLKHLAERYTVYVQLAGTDKSWFIDPKPTGYYELKGLDDGVYMVSILIKQGYPDEYLIAPKQIDYKVHIQNGAQVEYNWKIQSKPSHKERANLKGSLGNAVNPRLYQVTFHHLQSGKYYPARFDEKGQYILTDIPIGLYEVNLDYAGKADGIVQAQTYPKQIEVKKGETKTMNFALK
ncbi:MAG: carboxypeptidase-like regulatory domain-containing protein [Bacteroidota bacterium]